MLVPSLINPPHILDLDADVSLAEALSTCGRVLLLDWGPAAARPFSVADHVSRLLDPLLQELEERPVLTGYCLGGTMALAAAEAARARGVITLASPWRFSAYPREAIEKLTALWRGAEPAARKLGLLPTEVLQAAFWSLDPDRTVAKFARLASTDPATPAFQRFVALEDWANSGDPLPYPAARELLEQLFGMDTPGTGEWRIAGRSTGLPSVPCLHVTAQHDRIVPPETAAPGRHLPCSAGHVGMIVGRHASEKLHRPLREWLAALPSRG